MNSAINKILSITFFTLCSLLCHSQIAKPDSLSTLDTTIIDTVKFDFGNISLQESSDTTKYKVSKDAINTNVDYSAKDSIISDIANKRMHLYGEAQVEYESVKLNADYIIVDFDNDLIQAFYSRDSLYKPKFNPTFVDGETKAGFKEMKYNFKTKKAVVKNITTHEAEFFLLGETSKFVGKENDTLFSEDKFFNQRAIITTCNHPTPHFGIRTRKLKFIPNKIAVMGPSQLEIMGIPTPLILPFGFFPLVKGQSSGIIFPDDYQYNPQLGFGLQGIGYYFPINDYIDARVTGDIWSRGTYSINVASSYKKRYKYQGAINFNYTDNRLEGPDAEPLSQKSIGLQITHNQDSKAHPYRTIGGSINIQTNRNQQRTNYDYNTVFNNQLSSNFNFNYRFPESPFNFTSSFQHSQNNQTRRVTITFPNANINMNTIQPFKRKNATGDLKWYENVSVSYKASLKNYVETTDTTLFTKATLQNLQTGLNHGTNVSTNFRVLKYFNVSPSMTYDETYFIKTINRTFDRTLQYRVDTLGVDAQGNAIVDSTITKYGMVNQELVNGLEAFRKFNTGISLNTQIFGTKTFSKGWLRGIRHIVKPSVNFNYSPDTYDKYSRYVDTHIIPELNVGQYYNPFQTGPFSQSLSGEQMAIGYSINNVVDLKYRGKKDTVDKKLTLFPNINISGNYNFAADSFKWSNVNLTGNAPLIKGLSNLQFGMIFTPYEINYRTKRLVHELLSKNGKGLLQLVMFNANINTSFSFTQLKNIVAGKPKTEQPQSEAERLRAKKSNTQIRSFADLFENFNFNHTVNFSTIKTITGKDSLYIGTNSIYINGSIPLSAKWRFNVGSIAYDFKNKTFVYPSFSFSRDLHCWNMSFAWFPESGVYSFFVGVKANSLNFLKYNYGQPFVPGY